MGMKIAVSIPDPVFDAAEAMAKERGIPRSQLYAEALRDYLANNGPDAITARLDAVYSKLAEGLDPAWQQAQSQAVGDESW